MKRLDCRYFNGYKPCGFQEECDDSCSDYSSVLTRILVVHLEALGAVLRATSLLPAIKRKFPKAHITWVTQAPADKLLENNPLIDRILTTHQDDLLILSALEFDFGYCIDKSLKAVGVIQRTSVLKLYGFGADQHGVIVPLTSSAEELWELGLSNKKKFFENRKAETQLMVEALELGPFQRDEYIVQLTLTELQEVRRRRSLWSGDRKAPLVGINTGCAGTIPAKKLSIEGHRMLIRQLTKKFPHCKIVLLGGPEDDQRNRTIGKNLPVIQSPYCSGLRDGIVSVAACDLVISGDSLGMHMSIALKKWIVAWFGPTCDHEIDIYDRGVKVLADVNCSPCWKRSCDATVMCYDRVNFETVCEGVEKGLQWLISSSKPHFWEISS